MEKLKSLVISEDFKGNFMVQLDNARTAMAAASRLIAEVQADFPHLDKDCCRSMLFRSGELIGDARILTKDARDDIMQRFT
jgi:hypothetical protein